MNKANDPVDSGICREPQEIVKAYTENSIWRNRDQFAVGHAEIVEFLIKKWEKEKDYRLRKELFCWHDDKIAVQFWYEYRDALDGMKWKRCYGLEDWTFDVDGRMRKRQMSGNDVELKDGDRWFVEGKSVEEAEIGDNHW